MENSEFKVMYDRRKGDERLTKLEIEVSSLKEKIAFFTVIYDKLDLTLSKVQELMEDRRNEFNQDFRDVYQKIQDTENKLMSEFNSLRQEMKNQHEVERNKLADLEKWRWMVVGAASIAGWFLSKYFGN